ncbi:FAD-dependent oxidoreductase [Nocardia sp. NPDC058705]|uniref:FAD-dependent oxidoreductase n=1 Tax=Nocardia sp. NPDC058705 TaxID=3346609 RepID=UPI0036B023E8
MTTYSTDIAIIGAGPGGLSAAVALSRAGLSVTVVEKTLTTERSFRGESLSPDAVALLDALGVLDDITATGALVTRKLEISEAGHLLMSADFADFDYPQPYPREVPQPTLLNALEKAAAESDGFRMLRGANVTDLIIDDGRVLGLSFTDADGAHEVRAALVVGADGRYSKTVAMSELDYERIQLDRDVVWMRTPLPEQWDTETYRIRMHGADHGLFIPTYPDMVRVGFNIPKGSLGELRKSGIATLHQRISDLAPELSDLVREHVTRFTDTSTLDIFTSRMPRWSRPGLVFIGDAAHTLSPVLGQGVNHALIDGVVLAELVSAAFGATAGRDARLDTAVLEFQGVREPDVAASRGLQLRQEWLFSIGHPVGVLARSSLYRALNIAKPLRLRILSNAYFRLQRQRGDLLSANR